MKARIASIAALALAGCAIVPEAPGPQQQFFQRLLSLCGAAYEGRVVTSDDADRDFAASRLLMHVRTCSADEVRIPFHVGNDHSRIWVISRTADGLRLKHVHRHQDGSEDVLSQYGGDTVSSGTARRQQFPADRYSRELFVREDIPQSAGNIWAVEVAPDQIFAYELRRPGRFLRVEFDITLPVSPPPAPWGER